MSEPWVKRKRGLFYSPNNSRYTSNIALAGFYSREEAEADARRDPTAVTAAPVSAYRDDAVRNLEITKDFLARLDAAIAKWNTTSEGPSKDKLPASPDAGGGPIIHQPHCASGHRQAVCTCHPE